MGAESRFDDTRRRMDDHMMRRAPIGYWYWHMQRGPFGWRQIGPEAHCVVDDFGSLVFTGWMA